MKVWVVLCGKSVYAVYTSLESAKLGKNRAETGCDVNGRPIKANIQESGIAE